MYKDSVVDFLSTRRNISNELHIKNSTDGCVQIINCQEGCDVTQ